MIILLEKWKEKRQEELQKKIYTIRYWITKFFEDLRISEGTVEVPAWIECKNLMKKLCIDIDHPKIVDYYYKKIQKNV